MIADTSPPPDFQAPPADNPEPAQSAAAKLDLDAYIARAEARREEAVEFAKSSTWNGKPLQPWSRERESILSRLILCDKLPVRPLDELAALQSYIEERHEANPESRDITLGSVCDLSQYFPTAAKLLFIASSLPEALVNLRMDPPRFLLAVDEWAERNIREDQIEACFIAQKIRFAYRSALALPRPSKFNKGSDEGN
jgi:hypothetical protein